MPTETLVLATVVAVAIVLLNVVVIFGPRLVARRRDAEAVTADDFDADRFAQHPAAHADDAVDGGPRGREAYERVVRVVALGFLAAAGAALTLGLGPPSGAGTLMLVFAAIMAVVLIQDVIPASFLGAARYVVEALAALAFLTALVALTGGVSSPFFFGYFLLVIAASLWMHGAAPLVLALVASIAYVVSVIVVPGPGGLGQAEMTRVAFNLLALGLLAYVASVVSGEQRRSREAAVRLSRFDPLTGLYNRNYFFLMLEREVQRAARIKRRFCLLMLDVDDLKPVNDQFGHHYGDRLLRGVSEVIRGAIRASDLAAKYGGDEFVVILPETDPAGAYILAEKLRAGIGTMALRTETRLVRTSVSIGIATYPDDGTTGDQLVMAADAAMYRSKQLGKNRVTVPGLTEAPISAMSTPIVAGPPAPLAGDETARPQPVGVPAPASAAAPQSSVMPAGVAERSARPSAEPRPERPQARYAESQGYATSPPAPPPAGTTQASRQPEPPGPRRTSFGGATRRGMTPVFPPRRPPVQSVDVDPWGPVETYRPPWDAQAPEEERAETAGPELSAASTPEWPPPFEPRRLPGTGTLPSMSDPSWRTRRPRREDERGRPG